MPTRRRWIAAALGFLALPALSACGSAPTASTSTPTSTQSSTPVAATPPAKPASVEIAETGSSLLYPLFNLWAPAYEKIHSNVRITTASTGSGEGISQSVAGLVQIGASDAYMSDSLMKANPGMLNIPLAISAQQIMYNVPGVSASAHLHLSGPVIAGIYTGAIKYWDDPKITALNSGVKLPHKAIVPVRRSDGSGDTFLFTQFLTDSAGSPWSSVGYGTTVTWPALSYEVAAKGNQGVVQALQQTPGGVGYVGISWLNQALKDGLGYAALQNKAGKFVTPDATSITASVKAMVPNTPADERISLIFAPGAGSYPIINFEYALVQQKQKSAAQASAVQALLGWALQSTGGNASSFLNQVHFVALPSSVVTLSNAQIAKITG